MEGIERFIKDHPFFAGLDESFVELLAGCAKNARFEAGEFILEEGGPADHFYLIRHGKAALQLHAPGGALTVQTLGEGDVAGVSWLFAPYRWSYDVKAIEPVVALAMDAKCLRDKCEADHSLGYELMKRFVPVLTQRLQATRLQLLDIYGAPNE